MVELSHRPEISVAQLAREHGINDNLLFKWRQYWREGKRHCCKVSDEAAFCLIQRPYISKTLLTRRISPRGSP
ncbi:transposase [Escherichia coli]|uniref:transposase n=1 Tax=Escherichia coli TaxID=562 RepID=UPI003DA48433